MKLKLDSVEIWILIMISLCKDIKRVGVDLHLQ